MTVSAAQFNVALEALADRTAHVRALIDGGPVSATFYKYFDLPSVAVWGDSTNLAWLPVNTSTGGLDLVQSQIDISASQFAIYAPLEYPLGWQPIGGVSPAWVLDSITISLIGSAGHGALPVAMPDLALYVAGTIVGSPAVDTSASTGAYESAHTITLSPSAALSAGDKAHLRIRGEAGANAQAGLYVATRVVTAWTVSTEIEGA